MRVERVVVAEVRYRRLALVLVCLSYLLLGCELKCLTMSTSSI
jgi:hypothetical protein